MKKTKYILVLTACAILLGIVIMLVTMKKTDSGTCGEKLTWVLDKDGTLTISGEGEMYDWSTSNSPWYSNFGNRSIKEVVIDNGVTSIGGFAFDTCSALTTITIPDSVTSIGDDAFCDCDALTSITIQNPECEIYDHRNTISDTATIHSYANSTAQAYAKKYGRNFEVIG